MQYLKTISQLTLLCIFFISLSAYANSQPVECQTGSNFVGSVMSIHEIDGKLGVDPTCYYKNNNGLSMTAPVNIQNIAPSSSEFKRFGFFLTKSDLDRLRKNGKWQEDGNNFYCGLTIKNYRKMIDSGQPYDAKGCELLSDATLPYALPTPPTQPILPPNTYRLTFYSYDDDPPSVAEVQCFSKAERVNCEGNSNYGQKQWALDKRGPNIALIGNNVDEVELVVRVNNSGSEFRPLSKTGDLNSCHITKDKLKPNGNIQIAWYQEGNKPYARCYVEK